ncbi:hypothetical protein LSH36_677g04047 [Paralvinella palmiformis]|uniref:BTB domain-containing protein n=1 Tax=Paralvinella palmiformis TaxID=53620 RepID=A0AAD9J2S9_9ANNE|nr:hypothetical protein LSH36_677g04047 [Paralvinella palmiformis]
MFERKRYLATIPWTDWRCYMRLGVLSPTKTKMESGSDENFMDFNELVECPRAVAISRPMLNNERQTVYEDSARDAHVLSEMHRFYQDKRLCDIILVVESARFRCHRLVLAASSLYFERMFSNDMSESRASEITLKVVTACAVKNLLEYAYTSKLSVTQDTALEVFEAADMLQFPSARMFCQDFLMDEIDEKNCLSFLLYADAFSCESMYEKAKLMAAKHFQSVCVSQEFNELPFRHLVSLLAEDGIEMEYEEHVYEAMKRWLLHDEKTRQQHLADLFKCIRLNFVSRWFLIEVISKDKLIKENEACSQIMQNAKDQLLAQGHTYEIPWQMPPSRKCTGLTQKIVYINTYHPNPAESNVFLFDLVNKSWSCTSKPCPLASDFSTCESIDDILLVIGGWTPQAGTKSLNQRGAVNIIHEFRVMSIFPTLWYVGAHSMGISRYLHSTISIGKQIYLLGGYDETQSLQASVFVTDSECFYKFDVCPRMLYPVCRPALATWGSFIYVFGGFGESGIPRQFIQRYDITNQKWSEIIPGIEGVYVSCQYATTIDDLIYVCCGELASYHGSEDIMVGHLIPHKCLDCILCFNPLTNNWKTQFQFPVSRTGRFSITCFGNKIYITGGESNGVPHNTVEVYDPETNLLEVVGNTREGEGALSLCTTMTVMHENFGM